MKKSVKICICIICLTVALVYILLVVLKDKETMSRADETSVDKIWVGTFQLAWNELIEKFGGPIELEGKKILLLNELNEQKFTKEMISENSYYIKTGNFSTELRNEIIANLKKRFDMESSILDRIDCDNTNNDYLIYAMLNKSFTFEIPFKKFVGTFGNFEDNLQYFGLDSQTNKNAFKQVNILFYNSTNDFAIEINTKEGEQVILYRTEKHKDFETSYNELENKTTKYAESREMIAGKDELKVPFIKLEQDITYDELCNKVIKGTGGATIKQAIQTVKFSMDNYGGNIVSEAAIYGTASFATEEPRYFNFNDKFILYLKEENKSKPYFALLVDNIDVLVNSEEN